VTREPQRPSSAADPATQALSLAEQLLDVEAAATLLNVKPSTLYDWVRSGAMPCLRLGPRAIRFTRPMLEDWLASRLDPGRPD
jgi:excisionase family DNA binding protein